MPFSSPPDRRLPLGEVPLDRVRRSGLTLALFLVVLAVFLAMVHEMLVAGVLGALAGGYLRPVQQWIAARTGRAGLGALATMALLIVPAVALVVYGYVEVYAAADYLASHTADVAAEINAALDRMPFVSRPDAAGTVERLLDRLAARATELPEGAQEIAAEFAIDASVFLFTAYYVLTSAEEAAAYLRARVAERYEGFVARLERHVHSVLYGAVYGALVTQTLKALLVLALNLAFGVPLPVVLALLAFVIGFFPVVGSWTIYVPAAGYLLVFQDAPWEAVAMVVIGFVGSTLILSMLVRPKLAADRSRVLNFYWMFVALVAGVYTFGVSGVVIGPIVVGVLKAVLETVTESEDEPDGGAAETEDDDEAMPEAQVFEDDEDAAASG